MFMENARLLMLEMILNVHRAIHLNLLASMLCLEEEECKKWLEECIANQMVDLTLKDKCVAVNRSVQSL